MAGLLNKSPEVVAPSPEAGMPPEEPMDGEQDLGGEGNGGFTIDAGVIGDEILSKAEPEVQQQIKDTVAMGMKLLFGKDSHDTIFDSINQDDQVPIADELGSGATNIMLILFNQATENVKKDPSAKPITPVSIVPAGTILLAKTAEFINKSGMAPITDQDYADAVEMFMTTIQDKLNPNFRAENGLPPREGVPVEAQGQELPAQAPPAPPPGLLNQGVQ